MEHVRLTNGKEYELVVGGFSTTSRDQLKIMFDPGADTFEQIEEVFNNPANVERIEVVDTANEVFESQTGYTDLASIQKIKDYVVGREPVSEDEDSEIVDITKDIFQIVLKKADITQQVTQISQKMTVVERAAVFSAAAFTDEQTVQVKELYPSWVSGANYKVGNYVCYGEYLYRCLSDHTSQEAWNPAEAASLWVMVDDPSEEWPEWRQPLGSTDAYPNGAKVSYNGKHWVSSVDNNVWEPGVYGWTEEE